MESMPCAFRRVILCETLAEPVRLHAHDGVNVLIERVSPAEDVNGNRVFLDLAAFAGEGLFAEIRKKMCQGGSARKEFQTENGCQFRSLRL